MAAITHLKHNDSDYNTIYKDFTSSIPNIKIHSIIKIDMSNDIASLHNNYKKYKSPQRLYHGTKQYCNITNLSDIKKLCESNDCG